jgi:hypothetical protein
MPPYATPHCHAAMMPHAATPHDAATRRHCHMPHAPHRYMLHAAMTSMPHANMHAAWLMLATLATATPLPHAAIMPHAMMPHAITLMPDTCHMPLRATLPLPLANVNTLFTCCIAATAVTLRSDVVMKTLP